MTKICPRCGYQNQDEQSYCIRCGYDLRNVASTPGTSQNQGNPSPYPSTPSQPGPNPYGSQAPGPGYPYSNPVNPRLESIRTFLLIAYIFSILALVFYAINFLSTLVGLFFVIGFPGGFFGIGFILIHLIVVVVFAALGFLVFQRVSAMYRASKEGDVATLKSYNSIGWAVIALIFGGVITGIMLLIAYNPISEL